VKRLIFAFAAIFVWTSSGWAAPPPPIASVHDARALTNAQASHALPVNFEATVTFFRARPRMLYVQDGDSAIYVFLTRDFPLVLGDRVQVRGVSRPSFLPIIESNDVTVIHHGTLPKPVLANYSGLAHHQYLCKFVTVRATILSAAMTYTGDVRGTSLHLSTAEGPIDAAVLNNNSTGLKDLLDADVEVTGVAGTLLDSKMQKVGIILHTNSMADVKVLKRASRSPWTLPISQLDSIFDDYQARNITARVRVQGTITYYQPGAAVVLQSGTRSLWISTQTNAPLQIGDFADATGFPDFHNGFLNLVRGEVQDNQVRAPITPLPASWQDLSSSDNIHLGHIYDLVSTEGKVVTEAREAARDEYVLSSNGKLFTAVYYHSNAATLIPLPPMKRIPVGATVRVSGICVQLSSSPFNGEIPFDILLRSFDDIQVIARPSLITVRNMAIVVALLIAVVLVVGVRSFVLERRGRMQTVAVAYLEKARRRILEDINGSRPLTEIIEQITEAVSFRLRGARCWCAIAEGAQLGSRPPSLTALRIVQQEIPGRSGLALGTLYIAFDLASKPIEYEAEALAMGVGLAALAIETRRLYSDLLHRSEFDQLTDIQNRFSLEKSLEALIQTARQTARIFGLVYIDLDDFKQVNDKFGHHIGDLYLQEAALRMKQQLRPGDILARVGGDEFVVLVPAVRSRSDVDEIAMRLERCFDEAFVAQGNSLQGSTSVGIALYPADASNMHALLRVADAAMYEAKNAMKKTRKAQALSKFDDALMIKAQ
jgi:diguanylate cyclase (GGDEF)-like protein